jgi:hypothetical protein
MPARDRQLTVGAAIAVSLTIAQAAASGTPEPGDLRAAGKIEVPISGAAEVRPEFERGWPRNPGEEGGARLEDGDAAAAVSRLRPAGAGLRRNGSENSGSRMAWSTSRRFRSGLLRSG